MVSLAHQLEIATPSLLIADPDNLSIVVEAAANIGLTADRVIVMHESKKLTFGKHLTTEMLIEEGSQLQDIHFYSAGFFEVKSKIAFLCFSSGTTGLPKVLLTSVIRSIRVI